MHIYWFYFIIKLLVRIAVGGALADNREKSDWDLHCENNNNKYRSSSNS